MAEGRPRLGAGWRCDALAAWWSALDPSLIPGSQLGQALQGGDDLVLVGGHVTVVVGQAISKRSSSSAARRRASARESRNRRPNISRFSRPVSSSSTASN